MSNKYTGDQDDNIVVLTNEEDEKSFIEKTNKLMRDKMRKFEISLSVPGLSPDDNNQIKSQIRNIIQAEIEKIEPSQITENTIKEPTNLENKINISLDGLGLPAENTRQIESRVQEFMSTKLKTDSQKFLMQSGEGTGGVGAAGAAAPAVPLPWPTIYSPPVQKYQCPPYTPSAGNCICATSGVPGATQSGFSKGLQYVFSHPGPLPLNVPGSPFTYWVVGFYFTDSLGAREDTARMLIYDYRGGLPRDQMWVGLRLLDDSRPVQQGGTGFHTAWGKEIIAWNLCKGRVASIHVEGKCTPGPHTPGCAPVWMHLCRGCDQTDTLVFNKPKTFGRWELMYNLPFDVFWDLLGGYAILFDWVWDG
jgi:hypothetical protein